MVNLVKIQCPCCGYYTHESEAVGDPLFEICPVCFCQYDIVAHNQPDRIIGANHISLNDAKENYKKYGICEQRFIGKNLTRKPLQDELPENNQGLEARE